MVATSAHDFPFPPICAAHGFYIAFSIASIRFSLASTPSGAAALRNAYVPRSIAWSRRWTWCSFLFSFLRPSLILSRSAMITRYIGLPWWPWFPLISFLVLVLGSGGYDGVSQPLRMLSARISLDGCGRGMTVSI
jgi:hypothetical protein